MRRVCVALAFALALGQVPLSAQDDPKQDLLRPDSPFDLVRKLRENGLIDLATQRLNDLKANPALLPADQAPLILFEVALNKLEEASRETEEARRAGTILKAREAFGEFIKANPKHPRVAQANVEIARLYALQAKAQLSRAGRLEGDARANAFSLARPDFQKAIDLYKQATTALDTAIKGLGADNPQAGDLTAAKHQAELDTVVLEFEKARTFTTDGERTQRGDAIVRAKKQFSALADKYAGNRVGFLAMVWAQQCDYENGDPRAAQEIDKLVTANRTNKVAADAVRLAGFFGIQHTFDSDTAKDTSSAAKYQRTDRAAETWLKAYPQFKNTPEGLGALYRRGLMKERQAFLPGGLTFAAPPKAKTPPKASKKDEPKEEEPDNTPRKIIGISASAKVLLEDANRIYKELCETDNEYTERAHRKRLTNQLIIMEGEGKGNDPPLRTINTLEQGVLYAQVQQARMFTPRAPDGRELEPDEAEKEVNRRTRLAIEYLERALQKSTSRDAPRDVFDAQMLLVLFLTKSDRAVEAAVIGEALARNNPKAPKAATAAQLAVYAYNTALGKLKQKGEVTAKDQAADLDRIQKLGAFAISTWPTDGPTDAIRHVLAFYQNQGGDREAAWTTYSQITPGYSAAAQARLEMGAVMFNLVIPATDEERKRYREVVAANITSRAKQWQATLRALEVIPEPLDAAPAAEAEAWTRAKTQLAQLHLIGTDYDKSDAVLKAVVARVPKFTTLPEDKRADLGFGARALRYTALQAKAADLIKAKEFGKAADVLDPELAAMKAELSAKVDPKAADTAAPNLDRMRKNQQGFLIAAMSAYVQDKKADKANELLDLLEKTGGSLESSVEVMKRLANSIRAQIDELDKAGNKAEADGLKQSFGEFLNKIKGDDPGKLSAGVVAFLGQGYGAVDQHAKAAELYQTLLEKPFVASGKTDEEKAAAEEAHKRTKRSLTFQQARAYRLAGDKESFNKAAALMKEIVGEPLAAKPTRGWGYANINVRKEYIALLEDQKLFGPAVQNWLRMTRDFIPAGLPAPVKFIGQRPEFEAAGKAIDGALAAHFGIPGRLTDWFDNGFKTVYPPAAAKRKDQRDLYFDLYYEAQRCSARAFSTVDPAKYKGGQEAINTGLTNIAQRLFDVVTKNDDVPAETVADIQALVEKHPLIKKRFEELKAAAPKTP